MYDQDCAFFRHHDGLMWSRFQTAAAIEGGMLYAAYQLQLVSWDKKMAVVAGSLLVALTCLQMLNDRKAALEHLDRIKKWEKPIEPFEKSQRFQPFGGQLKATAAVTLNALNVVLIWRFMCAP